MLREEPLSQELTFGLQGLTRLCVETRQALYFTATRPATGLCGPPS